MLRYDTIRYYTILFYTAHAYTHSRGERSELRRVARGERSELRCAPELHVGHVYTFTFTYIYTYTYILLFPLLLPVTTVCYSLLLLAAIYNDLLLFLTHFYMYLQLSSMNALPVLANTGFKKLDYAQ